MAPNQPKQFVLRHRRAPGDIIMLTALVRDIKAAYPEAILDLDSTCKELWDNNPHISKIPLWNHNTKDPKITVPGTRFVNCHYGQGIKEQKRETIHFVRYFHRDFTLKTGLQLPLTRPYGDIHLSAHERNNNPITGRYWVVLSGGKDDFTIKVWHTNYFQSVVNQLRDLGIQCVQIGDNNSKHWHPTLTGTLDLRGKTSLRHMLQLIHHSDGVICGVTAAMHMAAALQRPCVCIAGGREAWYWEAYVRENQGFGSPAVTAMLQMPHRFLHTIGLLDCCKHHGCWKNKVVKISADNMLCKYPIHTPEMPIAKCMHIITPRHVVEAVMSYYEDKSLPPIGMPSQAELQPLVIDNRPPTTLQVSTGITLRSDPQHVNRTISVRPGTGNLQAADVALLDNKAVGSRFTIFVLFYGGEQFFDMHNRCIESIIATVPQDRVDIRVGSNQLNDKSVAMLDDYVNRGQITKHYRHTENAMKYPVMREMFFDPTLPIKTKWVIWFDDDSMCDKNPEWLTLLGQHIVSHHKNGNNHMFGSRLIWTLSPAQKAIFQSRKWFTGKPWQNAGGKPVPAGTKITFATGGFWAITHEAIIRCDIPDLTTGLTHNGGDWQIGCQLYQQGMGLKQFNGNKQFVNTSSVPRRGITVPTINKSTVVDNPVVAAIPVRPVQAVLANDTQVQVVTAPPVVIQGMVRL
jgi:ADP-heptose:LPS heptosyltransferase